MSKCVVWSSDVARTVKRGFQPTECTQRIDEVTQAPANRNRAVLFPAELKTDLDLLAMTLIFSRRIEVVEQHVRAKFHQAKCNGS